jgi:membrane-bound lytic murein transglycosylase D
MFYKRNIFTVLWVIVSSITICWSPLLTAQANTKALTAPQLTEIIASANANQTFQISATPSVLNKLNAIIHSEKSRADMHTILQRMQPYQPTIDKIFQQYNIPADFIAIPIVESEYKIIQAHNNYPGPAGLWQMQPETAKKLGLTVNAKRDDRFDIQLSTIAAAKYLQLLYGIYHNWNMVLVAYNIGDSLTTQILKTQSDKNIWAIANAKAAPDHLKVYITSIFAAVIILHQPQLVAND